MKHFTNQEIEEAVKKAPKFIQDEISGGEDTAIVIAQIGQEFKLHIDVIGMIAELNRNMLLGLMTPPEFLSELIAAKIPDSDARAIVTEINEKIFVPLREEMRKGPAPVMQPPKPAAPMSAHPPVLPQQTVIIPANPQMPSRPPQMFASVPRYTPPIPALPKQPEKHFHLQNKIPPPARPAQPPRSGSQISNPAKLLEDHEEPHIEFKKTVPPPNLPGALPPARVPEVRPSPTIPKVEPPAPRPPTRPPYSVDPYREPIE